jgi:outer membrane protein assembly factor BamB
MEAIGYCWPACLLRHWGSGLLFSYRIAERVQPPMPIPVARTSIWLFPFSLAVTVFSLTSFSETFGQNWTGFRGDQVNGVVPESSLPADWSEQRNVRWKTPIHGRGWSSPVVEGNEIWLTTATEDGLKMYVLCIDLESGKILHDRLLFENAAVQPDYHETNSYASPTPVIDSEHVFVHFGAYGTACLLRSDCSTVWQRRDLPCNHYRGAGSSPILHSNLLIFHMDGFDYQYAVALDRKSGETVWKADRQVDYGTDNGDYYKAFSTPLVIAVGQRQQLISPASMACLSLDPLTGKELWRVRYDEHSTTVRPVFDGERIFLSTGFSKAKLLCVDVSGRGDVTQTHVVWSEHRGVGCKPSPVLVDGKLFVLTDDGILSRFNPETGESGWRTRLGGSFSASLVASSDRLIALDHDGKGYVFSISDNPELLSQNLLEDGCNASPAIIGDSLLIRTKSALYRIESQK